MTKLFTRLGAIVGFILLVAMIALAGPASAQQQPNVVNPSARVETEQQLLNELHRIQGRGSIPDVKSYVLEQPTGRQWRIFHEVYLHWIAGTAIAGIFSLLALFYFWHGTLHFKGGRSGRTMLRFTVFERFVHWMTTTCFVVLAISGLNISFGKGLLLPLIGPNAFSAWSEAAKYAHNFLSFPFTIGVVLMFLMWVASNLPTRVDVEWIKHGGGMFGGEEPPAYKFNAGEKLIFWIVVIGAARPPQPAIFCCSRSTGLESQACNWPKSCTASSGCSISPHCSSILIWARLERRVPSKRWPQARSTSTGRNLTTRYGTKKK